MDSGANTVGNYRTELATKACSNLCPTIHRFFFIKFFIFGEAPSADDRASARATSRRQRTLSHTGARQRALSSAFHSRPSSAVLKPRPDGGLTVQKILEKTYYDVHGHQPESLDWFNVLIAQTIAQLRADAQEDEAVLTSLTALLNGGSKPDFLDDIRVTEISLGDEFPIFSNCRVIPVDENGMPIKELKGNRGERLQGEDGCGSIGCRYAGRRDKAGAELSQSRLLQCCLWLLQCLSSDSPERSACHSRPQVNQIRTRQPMEQLRDL